jgi:hypothetical protein
MKQKFVELAATFELDTAATAVMVNFTPAATTGRTVVIGFVDAAKMG